jgi:hypothetical protein
MLKKLILLALFVGYISNAQLEAGSIGIDYTLAPLSEDGVDFSKASAKLRLPTQLKKGLLLNSFGVDYYKLNYSNSFDIQTNELEKLYAINYSIGYVRPLTAKWILMGQVGTSLSSNLTRSISSDDFIFRGGINAIKRGGTLENPSRLTFGLNYTTITGEPRILPMISFTKKVNDKFSYGIGFPNTHAKYNFNEKHSLKSLIWINGFYSNLGNPILVDADIEAEKASYRAVSFGLEYNYLLNSNISLILKGGYSVSNEYHLLDTNNNEVYDFDTTPEPYFSVGLKYKLNK